jgi:hypothetical protein
VLIETPRIFASSSYESPPHVAKREEEPRLCRHALERPPHLQALSRPAGRSKEPVLVTFHKLSERGLLPPCHPRHQRPVISRH